MDINNAQMVVQSVARNNAVNISPQWRNPVLYDLNMIFRSLLSGSMRYFIITNVKGSNINIIIIDMAPRT